MDYLDFVNDRETLADAIGDGVAYAIESDSEAFEQMLEALTSNDNAQLGKLVREHIRAIIEDEWSLTCPY